MPVFSTGCIHRGNRTLSAAEHEKHSDKTDYKQQARAQKCCERQALALYLSLSVILSWTFSAVLCVFSHGCLKKTRKIPATFPQGCETLSSPSLPNSSPHLPFSAPPPLCPYCSSFPSKLWQNGSFVFSSYVLGAKVL